MKEKLVRLGYILGIALMLAGLIYFFAANWPEFDRYTKLALSVGIMLLFYSLSLLFSKVFQQHLFLSKLLLFAGSVGFGIGVALIGQIYNSHANSYTLFGIWLIPVLLFAWVTRYQPFYILSLILAHLTIWFYFFPESNTFSYPDSYILKAIMLLILINVGSFLASEKKIIDSPILKGLSFIIGHVLFIWMSMRFFLEEYVWQTNSVYIAVLAGCFYYFLKVRQQNFYITVTGIATTVYLIVKYIEIIIEHFGPMIFVITLLLGALVIYLNVYIVKRLKARQRTLQAETEAMLDEDGSRSVAISKTRQMLSWQNLSTILFTVLSSIVITSSIIFLITDTISAFDDMAVFFFFMGLLLFLVPGVYVSGRNDIIGGTMICIGYIMSSAAVLAAPDRYLVIWAIFIVLGLLKVANHGIRMLLFGLFHIVAGFKLDELLREFDLVCITLIAVNVVIILLTRFKRQWLSDDKVARSLYRNSVFYGLLFFFILTFIEAPYISEWTYYVYNVLFFVGVTALVFWGQQQERSYELRIGLAFWFAFLFYKYYDLVWQLLHKSLALLILGLIFLAVTRWFEQRNSRDVGMVQENSHQDCFWSGKMLTILLIIVVQVAFMGYQVGTSEQALVHGKPVKLELVPLDPRSIMQGDYVILNYTISQLFAENGQQFPDFVMGEEWSHGQTVQIVLTPDEQGVHQFKEMYEGQEIGPMDVVMNGKYQGWRFIYGIENYYVPEGTGGEVERTMKYAYVRVAANGNAIIERLSDQ
ncbi:hypothetical protein BHU72_06980 [Desulfuribacillus stibiiarsenatis]|uniref:DUF2157 domain-containing protein n=1 Tax=Desulfuribacillus stibiiarsenatis TaxID=1390249 RepID=A0A1E5L4N0_9FIRM|nr:GDYXXLXY domain-containing protein [Desulfuribacillus stibiiarsenatis]OEH84929.1 hypothetical protein BHU72_06980 [Desulfuribacillus stibiiarsenatis]